MVRYYDDKKRYADLINGFIFRGGQVIKESDIVDLDSRSVVVYYGKEPWDGAKDLYDLLYLSLVTAWPLVRGGCRFSSCSRYFEISCSELGSC